MPPQANSARQILITGANKGIGFATARELGGGGHRIWLGVRSSREGTRAEGILREEGVDAVFIQLDVTDQSSIDEALAMISKCTATLDILVNNAGIMNESLPGERRSIPPTMVSREKLSQIYSTNLFGPIAMIQTALPLLRRSSRPRIVNVASRLGSFAHQTDEAWGPRAINQLGYSSSKAALNMATVMFAYELRNTRIKVNAVSPGTVATDLNGQGSANLNGKPGYATPEQGAQIVAKYALLPDDGPTGQFFGPSGKLNW